MIYDIPPVAKPRMTRSDKWKKRPAVVKYWNFKDKVRESGLKLTDKSIIIFYVPMPKTWSSRKRLANLRQPHKQRPDIDNYVKALFDALYEDDSHMWRVQAEKRWAYAGQIQIIEPLRVDKEQFEVHYEPI